jgi:hypothetical protein
MLFWLVHCWEFRFDFLLGSVREYFLLGLDLSARRESNLTRRVVANLQEKNLVRPEVMLLLANEEGAQWEANGVGKARYELRWRRQSSL